MIKESSIQKIFEVAQVQEVIGDFVELKKSGSTLKGLSPFSSEKTPSFMVSPSKQIWKCFSSGKGGGSAISFLQEHQNMTFPEAIEYLAKRYSIDLEFEESKEKSEEEKDFKKRCEKVLRFALNTYSKAIGLGNDNPPEALKYLTEKRGFSEETIMEWQLGFAPDRWDTLKATLIEKGYYKEANHLGLVRTKGEHNYDFFKNRIIFPIHSHRGELIGFGGRDLSGQKEAAKYLNSPESDFYQKTKVLYGLDRAIQAIKKAGKAYLTEGYTDVIAMHQANLKNTVATCGTSLTVDHAQLLSRFTNHVVLLRDGDAAGKKAAARDTQNLMKKGFKVEVCILPEGEDPDSICKSMNNPETTAA